MSGRGVNVAGSQHSGSHHTRSHGGLSRRSEAETNASSSAPVRRAADGTNGKGKKRYASPAPRHADNSGSSASSGKAARTSSPVEGGDSSAGAESRREESQVSRLHMVDPDRWGYMDDWRLQSNTSVVIIVRATATAVWVATAQGEG